MTKPHSLLLILIIAAGTFGFAQTSHADDGNFTIGSEAPNIDIEHWVSDGDGKFEHTTKLETGKVYVIEFWATWCGPCIRAMPSISQLQDDYADKGVQIISVSDEPLSKVDTFLEREVKDEEGMTYRELTSNYCLTADPDGSVFKEYFRAAGRTGIPCAFIVGKTGLVEWIGHPASMEKPLGEIVDDEWDREAYLVKYNKEKEAADKRRKMQQKLSVAIRKIQNTMGDEDYPRAVELIDELLEDEEMVSVKTPLQTMKNEIIILHIGGEQAIEALDAFIEKNKRNAEALNEIAWGIYEKNDKEGKVDEAILEGAIAAAEQAAKVAPKNGAVLDTLAHLVYVNGDVERALEIQEKAMKHAGRMEAELRPFLEQLRAEVKEKSDK